MILFIWILRIRWDSNNTLEMCHQDINICEKILLLNTHLFLTYMECDHVVNKLTEKPYDQILLGILLPFLN